MNRGEHIMAKGETAHYKDWQCYAFPTYNKFAADDFEIMKAKIGNISITISSIIESS